MKHAISALLALAMATPVHAAWYIQQPYILNIPPKTIDDRPYTFKMDDIVCTVTETQFIRVPNSDQISEGRSLDCDLGNDTHVRISGNCNYPLYELSSIIIRKGESTYNPAITCGPAK